MSIGQRLVLTGIVLLFSISAFLVGGQRSVVDWRAQRAIALESDDWGLAGFVPAADSWQGLDRQDLGVGRFPGVYWQSSLETAVQVDDLVDVLLRHRGRDGLPAVFQPNYVMGSLGWDEPAGQWVRYDLPNWPPEYQRPGLWQAVARGRRQGVWHPELHASLHYDPAVRRANAFDSQLASEVTRRGISLFPDSEKARELAPWRSETVMAGELDTSVAIFQKVFGRLPRAVIAPDYTWHAWCEELWKSRNLHIIQAKREQRNPQWLAGYPGRLQKYVDRQWARLVHRDRIYLERNCRLEPVQAMVPQDVVDRCVAHTYLAWQRGQPAIVESHRINFAHTDGTITATGIAALNDYLAQVCQDSEGPVFLCDSEIAQLSEVGTSWRVAGEQLVLRNATRSSRIVAIPEDILALLGWWTQPGPAFVRLVAGGVVILTGETGGQAIVWRGE